MPLNQLSLGSTLTWQLSLPVTGFAARTQGTDNVSVDLSGISLVTWGELFAAQYTIAAAGTQVVDLRSFTDPTGKAITGTKSLLLYVTVTGAAADLLNIKPNTASNALVWFFGTTADSVNVPGGGALLYTAGAGGTGATVDATHRNLLLANSGAAALTVKVIVVVSDV